MPRTTNGRCIQSHVSLAIGSCIFFNIRHIDLAYNAFMTTSASAFAERDSVVWCGRYVVEISKLINAADLLTIIAGIFTDRKRRSHW